MQPCPRKLLGHPTYKHLQETFKKVTQSKVSDAIPLKKVSDAKQMQLARLKGVLSIICNYDYQCSCGLEPLFSHSMKQTYYFKRNIKHDYLQQDQTSNITEELSFGNPRFQILIILPTLRVDLCHDTVSIIDHMSIRWLILSL